MIHKIINPMWTTTECSIEGVDGFGTLDWNEVTCKDCLKFR